jgi:ribA/ribD-fused uncharacterized protein
MIKLFDKDMNEIIFDDDSYKENVYPLENFSPYGLTIDKLYFPTCEHAFQYLKFIGTDEKVAEIIRNASSPDEARIIAHEYKKRRPSNWKEIKYDVMEEVMEMKVHQNEEVKEALLKTRDLLIAEYCIDEDTDWGIDRNNEGNNHLGKSLMKIRKRINK